MAMKTQQYFGNVNPSAPVYTPSGSAPRGTNAYAAHGAQGAFDDNYLGMGQKAAMDLSRASAQSQNNFYNDASAVQNRGALQGLQLMGQQKSNAYDRRNAAQDMQNRWMQDMFSGPLSGLM